MINQLFAHRIASLGVKNRNVTPSAWLRFLIIVLLVLGVFFRFVNLDRKVYWYDEAFTSLRVSGYTEAEFVEQVSSAHVIGIEELQKYQRPNPERGVIDTIKGLAVEEPQHPPLYYVMARFWVQWFGNSVAVRRSLSALISLLAFPCIYWLCLELFKSPLTGWVAVALIAVSPIHVLYAQEAREYSLWMVSILLSSAALLQAMRLKTKVSWGLYAVTLTVGLYSFLFSGLVAIGHGIYVAAIERFRLSKVLTAYLVASILGFIAFTPWLLIVISNLSQAHRTLDWASDKVSFIHIFREWSRNLSRVFVDWNYSSSSPFISLVILLFFILLLSVLVGYSLYFICRKTPKRVWLFILTLIGATALALILPDLIFGGQRSLFPRYLMPSILGVQLAVAYLLSTKITCISVNIQRQKLWQIITIALISSGVLSCTISSQAEVWWSKLANQGTPEVALIINQATSPLLISDAEMGDLLSLSYLLNPQVRLLIKPSCYACHLNSQSGVKPNIPEIPDNFRNVFLFKTRPDKKWLSELKQQHKYQTKLLFSERYGSYIWKLEKQ